MNEVKQYYCTKCGGTELILSDLYQTSVDYKTNKDGTRQKKIFRKIDMMSMEVTIGKCLSCGEVLDEDSLGVNYIERGKRKC